MNPWTYSGSHGWMYARDNVNTSALVNGFPVNTNRWMRMYDSSDGGYVFSCGC